MHCGNRTHSLRLGQTAIPTKTSPFCTVTVWFKDFLKSCPDVKMTDHLNVYVTLIVGPVLARKDRNTSSGHDRHPEVHRGFQFRRQIRFRTSRPCPAVFKNSHLADQTSCSRQAEMKFLYYSTVRQMTFLAKFSF